MRILNKFPLSFYVVLLENQEEAVKTDWLSVPVGSTHWSFATSTETALEEGESVDIEVANDERQPNTKNDGSVVATLSPGAEAVYIRASYRWVRAVKRTGDGSVTAKNKSGKKSSTTVYGSFASQVSS